MWIRLLLEMPSEQNLPELRNQNKGCGRSTCHYSAVRYFNRSYFFTFMLMTSVFFSQLERLENPNKPPITVYTESTRLGNLKRGLSAEDQELVDRLQKLKKEVKEIKVQPPSQHEIEERFLKLKNEVKELKQIPSQDEIEERLARLKGIDPAVYKKPYVFVQPRSDVDSVTALIDQISEEVAIDHQSDLPFPVHANEAAPSAPDDPEELLRREILAAQQDACQAMESLEKDEEIKER